LAPAAKPKSAEQAPVGFALAGMLA